MNKKNTHVSIHKRHLISISIDEDCGIGGPYNVKIVIEIDYKNSSALIEALKRFHLNNEIFTLDYFPEDQFIERVEVKSPLVITRHEVTCSRIGVIATFEITSRPILKYQGVNYIMKSEVSS